MSMVAALYVEENGAYYGLENVDPWPESRDALLKWGVSKQKVDATDLITNELIGRINQSDAAKVASKAKAYRYAR